MRGLRAPPHDNRTVCVTLVFTRFVLVTREATKLVIQLGHQVEVQRLSTSLTSVS
jgi:hypothetical protein